MVDVGMRQDHRVHGRGRHGQPEVLLLASAALALEQPAVQQDGPAAHPQDVAGMVLVDSASEQQLPS